MTDRAPENLADAVKAVEELTTYLTKLEASCRAVATEIAGLRMDLAGMCRGMPPPRRRRPMDPGPVPLRRR